MVIERMICLSNGSGTLPVEVRQNDYNAVNIRLLVYETPNALLDMTGMNAVVCYEKNGIPSEPYEAKVEDKSYLLFTFPASVAAETGKGMMQISLYAQDALAHSYLLPFVVEYSIPLPMPGTAKDPAPAFFQLIQDSLAAVRETENVAQIGEDYCWYTWSHELQRYISTEKLAIPALQFEVETGKPGEQVQLQISGPLYHPVVKFVIPPGRDGQIDGLHYYDEEPLGLGEANCGSSMQMARGDHVHPMPLLSELEGVLPVEKGGLGVSSIDKIKEMLGMQTYDNIAQIQNHSITLLAAGWTQMDELYEQTVTVAGVSADGSKTSAIVSPHPDRRNEKQYHAAEVRASAQGDGTITFTAVEVPTEDIVVNVMSVAVVMGLTNSSTGNDDTVTDGGIAEAAYRLVTPRTISLGGEATGDVQFDGSEDVTINADIKSITNAELEEILK